MEQQYGLSPRGGKPASRGNGNAFQSPNLGRNVKALSASHEDLTRLDRHQPIIIQNFELLTPNQLKFRRPSLSTANLYLSHASLSRSGGAMPDERPVTTAVGNRHPSIPIWSESRANDVFGNDKVPTIHDGVQPFSSSSSCSSSSKYRSADKPKRVTFSTKNTLYPYEPDQTPRSNSKLRKTDFIYPSNNNAFYQFEPFHSPSFGGKENNSAYNDHYNGKNGTTHNGHWIPRESVSSPRHNQNSVKSRLPQRSSLKQTSAANIEGVRQGHSNFDGHWPKVNGIPGQSEMHFSEDPTPERGTHDGKENTYRNIEDGNLNSNCIQSKEGDISLTDNAVDGDVSSKSNYKYHGTYQDNEANEANSNLSAMKDRNLNNGVDDLTSLGTYTNDNEHKSEDQDSNVALPDLESQHIGDILTNDTSPVKGNPDPVSNSNDNGNDNCENNNDSDEEHATSFIDVFSSYNVSDNEYNMSSNWGKRQQREDVISNISKEIETSNEYSISGDRPTQSTTNSTSNPETNNSDLTLASSSSYPKVIRLKFLADSDTQKAANQEIGQNDSGNGQNDLLNNGSRHSATTRHPKSASTRQLKTKSTIEAVDLSTLGFSSNERPKSQGDVNAQFLMNMYSASGDRKTSEEIEHEEQVIRPPSRKPTDKRVTYSVEDDSNHATYRDPLTSSSRGRQKERQFLGSSKGRFKGHAPRSARPLLKNRATSAHAMMVTGNRMLGQERVIAAEKFLIKTGNPTSSDRTALNRQLEQLIVSRSVSSRVKLTMERSRSNLM